MFCIVYRYDVLKAFLCWQITSAANPDPSGCEIIGRILINNSDTNSNPDPDP